MAQRQKVNEVYFVQCRLLGHAWDEIPSDLKKHGRRRLTGLRMAFRCVRCGTVREELWNSRGELVTRNYDYSENYQFARGSRVFAPVFRQVYLVERQKSGAPTLSWKTPTPIRPETNGSSNEQQRPSTSDVL